MSTTCEDRSPSTLGPVSDDDQTGLFHAQQGGLADTLKQRKGNLEGVDNS